MRPPSLAAVLSVALAVGASGAARTQLALAAGAQHAGGRVPERLLFALRVDVLCEHLAEDATGRAPPVLWPAPWEGPGTATVDYRTHGRVSLRLAYGHDHAGPDLHFGGHVVGDGAAAPFVVNRAAQDTLTLGATTWF
ncbi:MAG: hypothetical protein IT376_06200 [Polyangiaceae bacterium]|nr:hypothetical protein [Polyangiaceae bacterium]